ncbi:MAG: Fic family protein [Hyphomicrobiaceae bacterium]|nr:Fic family protein [Hyphomicrobiaceae bacterium]
MDPKQPYNDLPLLPPQAELETKAILKKCITARTALAELKLAGGLITDPSILIHAIPNLEAKDSSAIENIVTTNDELYKDASGITQESSTTTKEAARYRNALYAAVDTMKGLPLSARIAVETCRMVTGIDLDVRRTPGTTLSNTFTGEVIYTPPEGEQRLRGLLRNWEQFANTSGDIDPLVRMAVLHYQFEAIHPFPDGNGRTGRILNILSLIQDGLLDLPTLYLSRHILKTRGAYYSLLSRVTSHRDWEAWILYMLTAVEETSIWTTAKIKAIRALMDDTTAYVRVNSKLPHAVVEQIFTQTYNRIGNLVERGIAGREASAKYLRELERLGVLEAEKTGRDVIFLHRKYLTVLDSDDHSFEPYGAAGKPAPAKRRAATGETRKKSA